VECTIQMQPRKNHVLWYIDEIGSRSTSWVAEFLTLPHELNSRSSQLLGQCSDHLCKSCARVNMVYLWAACVFTLEHYFVSKLSASVCKAFSNALERMMFMNFVHHPCPPPPPTQKKHNLRELGLFPSSGRKRVAPTLLGPLERLSLNIKFCQQEIIGNYTINIKTTTKTMDKVHKHDSLRCNTPLSEHFRIDLVMCILTWK
jgi:hypothetical protein